MFDLLKTALKGGFRTSEFWLAVLAMLVPMLDHIVTSAQAGLNAAAQTHTGLISLGFALAAAVVASVYAFARSKLKGDTAKAVAVVTTAAYSPDPASAASARAGEALGIPPLPTGGNVAGYPDK